MTIISDGNVVHNSPYFHKLLTEKLEVDHVGIRGTEAIPFLVADMRSSMTTATMSAISAATRSVIHHQRTPGVRHSGGDRFEVGNSVELSTFSCEAISGKKAGSCKFL